MWWLGERTGSMSCIPGHLFTKQEKEENETENTTVV